MRAVARGGDDRTVGGLAVREDQGRDTESTEGDHAVVIGTDVVMGGWSDPNKAAPESIANFTADDSQVALLNPVVVIKQPP